ncbi:cobyrinate a,c-diamide synthase [Bailinhaonella thermotolerans]|uniref:Hydrogenobyrinate a,c-diamide synthase n=1 Tax=Bailinhaonella thermotolerans TaxID=1070861 RepID=A0A3A4ATF8_9ACTN|nr:cobyrinate a,c-diamide synthase [Bailinhaonella thermotolerans]RJL22842.1 cobyrinate a,c-diamide synthase [Bailinhaonella thermotolerans]
MTPRLVVAAPSSGSGKTTVATGLMAALSRRGMRVSPHKVGPDYIDPGYHALVTGRPGRNLDPWLAGEDLVAPLFLHGARGADIAVVEGVMGLFDGRDETGFASTAHVAALLGAPVVLVVDARGQGRSVAALVNGFRSFDPSVRLGGVVLNRLGSDRHEEVCRQALEDTGVPVLGAIRRADALATPSRHLGLVPAAERHAEAVRAVEGLAALVAASCDLDELVRLARTAAPLAAGPWSAPAALAGGADQGPRKGRPVVAVAGGPAFTFGYAEQAELLAAAGAEVAAFDPLRDEALPEGTRGLIVGGGFPEVYAPELSANAPLRGAVARLAAGGAPIAAECAGLLYLSRELDGAPMCGVVDAGAQMTPRLTLGYREAVAVSDSVLARAGERYRGHEFHRTAVRPGHGETAAWQWSRDGKEGFVRGNVVASYLHLHWGGSPHMAERFVEACG